MGLRGQLVGLSLMTKATHMSDQHYSYKGLFYVVLPEFKINCMKL